MMLYGGDSDNDKESVLEIGRDSETQFRSNSSEYDGNGLEKFTSSQHSGVSSAIADYYAFASIVNCSIGSLAQI